MVETQCWFTNWTEKGRGGRRDCQVERYHKFNLFMKYKYISLNGLLEFLFMCLNDMFTKLPENYDFWSLIYLWYLKHNQTDFGADPLIEIYAIKRGGGGGWWIGRIWRKGLTLHTKFLLMDFEIEPVYKGCFKIWLYILKICLTCEVKVSKRRSAQVMKKLIVLWKL